MVLITLFCSSSVIFVSDGKHTPLVNKSSDTALSATFMKSHFANTGCLTVMYNAEKIGLIQIEDIRKNNDYAMWLKICKKADCYLLDEELAMYRKRSGSISNHSYWKLIKWHYKLYREAEHQNVVSSIFNTCRNMVFGIYKKIKYIEVK